jgi:benzoate-CoA ligase
MHAHGSLRATAELYARSVLGMHTGDVVFSAAKLFFAYGLGNALSFPLVTGATAVLLDARPTPDAVKRVLDTYRPTLFFGVPTLYAMMLNSECLPVVSGSRLRRCVSAGEALPEAVLRRWRERVRVEILDGIGSTEMLHIFLSNVPGAVRPGSSGRVVPGYAVRLLNEAGGEVEDGEMGDLWVSGPSSAVGYWNQRAKTRETFQGRWVRAGDKYRRDADGFYTHCGRGDDMLKVGGIYVSPVEVESALVAHDAVVETAVVGEPDSDGLTKPKAYVVLAAGWEPSEELARRLVEYVRSTLAEFKRPRWIEFVEALPRTPTGKLQRYRLRSS